MASPTLNLTLSTTSFYVLLAVADRPLHDYGIRDQIIHDSDRQLVLAPGTLYPALKRMLSLTLLEQIEYTSKHPLITHRYRITAAGRHLLESEAKRLHRISWHARQKLGLRLFD